MEQVTFDLETERLEALGRYGVLDTEPEPSFERVVRLARQLLGVPTALVTLVVEERQWFKARVGFEPGETGRDVSFCDHTIRQGGVMVVRDAQKDPRFQDNPLVTGAPGIRFYAGAPLETPDGYKLGALCVIDTAPHAEFSAEAEAVLSELSALVMDALELRRAAAAAVTETAALRASETRLRQLVGRVPAVWTTDRELNFIAGGGMSLEGVGDASGQIPGGSLYKRLGVEGAALLPLAAHLRALGGETARYDLEVAGRSFEVRVEPLRAEDGGVTGCFGAAFDVTERPAEATLPGDDFTRVLVSISDAVWSAEADVAGSFVHRYFSPVVEALTGRPPEFFTARPDAWSGVVHPDDRAALRRADAKVAAVNPQGNSEGEREYRIVHADGSVRWVCERVRAEAQPSGARRLYGVLSDTTARKEAEHRAALQSEFRRELLGVMEAALRGGVGARFYERLLACAVRVIPGVEAGSLMLRDDQSRYTYVAAVGYDFERLKSTYLWESELARDDRPGPQLIYNYDANHEVEPERRNLLRSAGSVVAIKVSLSLPVELEGEVAYFNLDSFSTEAAFDDEAVEMARMFAQQIAVLLKRFELEKALEFRAYHDALTGLPNRHLFEKQLTRAVARSWDGGAPFAVILLDLDDFRIINDSRGHAFGDGVLKLIAARLGGALRGGDLIARWESDAFALLIADVGGEREAAVVAERLLTEVHEPLVLKDRVVRVRASLGIDLYPGGAERPEELLRHADIALYHAKAVGDSYKVFDEPMNQRVQVRLELEADLREALHAGSLTLHYQPRVRLADGHILSLEALARWQHPVRGWVAPSVFIPLAEQTGLIELLGETVLDAACAQTKVWERAGLPTRVAVNVSAEQLRDPAFVDAVERALARHDLAAALLELELTESAAMADITESVKILGLLRDLGVALAIDDFGTAYSSLAYLEKLPVHSLKVDQAFVKDLGRTGPTGDRTGGESIIRAVVALVRSFGLTVVVEGVETEVQHQAVKTLGCDEAQGYLFAKPQPAAQISELLRRQADRADTKTAPTDAA